MRLQRATASSVVASHLRLRAGCPAGSAARRGPGHALGAAAARGKQTAAREALPPLRAALAQAAATGGQRPQVLPAPSSKVFRWRLQNAHHWRMAQALGAGGSSAQTPPSAWYIFASCGVIESIFLCVNAGTLSPFVFEIAMPYHLKYTALVLGWWGGVYWGLNVARFGPIGDGLWFAFRTTAGLVCVAAAVTGLILADGLAGWGPWPSYWLLILSYSGMVVFDRALHQRQLIPQWLLKWKAGLLSVIGMSLLLGLLKGRYLEHNAQRLIMATAAETD